MERASKQASYVLMKILLKANIIPHSSLVHSKYRDPSLLLQPIKKQADGSA
jgi:hypothetical protein